MAHKMIKSTLKKINMFELWVLLISVTVIIELFIQPNIDIQKSIGGFFVFNILGFTVLSSELLVYTFILWGSVVIMAKKTEYFKKIIFAPKIYSPLPELIFLLILVSCIMGYSNHYWLNSIRVMLLPVLFYMVYINVGISYVWEKIILYIIIIGITGLTIYHLFPYYNLPFTLGFSGVSTLILDIQKFRYLNLMSLLVFFVVISRLLFSKFSFKWLFILLLFTYSFFLLLGLKSTILPLIFSLVLMFYFKIIYSRLGLIKPLIIVCTATLLIYGLVMSLPESSQDSLAYMVGSRYLKTGDITNVNEFKELPSTYKYIVNRGDIFSSRPSLWRDSLKESLKGFGLAPYGFGSTSGEGATVRAHNIIVFYAINSGIITALLILLVIVRYIHLNIKVFTKLKPGQYGLIRGDDLTGVFCFTIAIIMASMWEGSLQNIHVAFLFWFCIAIVLKRWDLMKEAA